MHYDVETDTWSMTCKNGETVTASGRLYPNVYEALKVLNYLKTKNEVQP